MGPQVFPHDIHAARDPRAQNNGLPPRILGFSLLKGPLGPLKISQNPILKVFHGIFWPQKRKPQKGPKNPKEGALGPRIPLPFVPAPFSSVNGLENVSDNPFFGFPHSFPRAISSVRHLSRSIFSNHSHGESLLFAFQGGGPGLWTFVLSLSYTRHLFSRLPADVERLQQSDVITRLKLANCRRFLK